VPLDSTQYTIHTHHRGRLRPCQPACTQYLSDTGNTAPRDREPGALPLERACSSPSRLPFRPCPRSERLLASAHIHSLLLLRAQGSVDPGMWPSKHQNQGGGGCQERALNTKMASERAQVQLGPFSSSRLRPALIRLLDRVSNKVTLHNVSPNRVATCGLFTKAALGRLSSLSGKF
jgi:hypothetical protein